MAEYLEKSKIKQYIKDFCKGLISDDRQFDPVDDAILLCQMIDFAPAADVVEVVRCKDCQHGENNYFQHGLCLCRRPVYTGNSETTLNVLCTSDSFCSYGERKTE